MSEEPSPPDLERIAPALGRVPSGLFVLIVRDDAGRTTGLLASWIQQASFEPPQVTVAVNKSRYLNEWLHTGAPVTINQLARKDSGLLKHFGRGFEPDADAFSGIATIAADNSLPLLADSMISLEGTIAGSLPAGDHIIYLVSLTAGHCHGDPAEYDPWVHIRRNGLSY